MSRSGVPACLRPQAQAFYQFEDSPGRLVDTGAYRRDFADAVGVSARVTGKHGLYGWTKGTGVVPHTDAAVGSPVAISGPAFTIEGWFQYKGGAPSGSPATHVLYDHGVTGTAFIDLIVQPSLVFSTTVVTLQVSTLVDGLTTIFQQSFTRDTSWHHFAATYTVGGNAELYADGVKVYRAAAPIGLGSLATDTLSSVKLFPGDYAIDDLALWAFAVSPADVALHAL